MIDRQASLSFPWPEREPTPERLAQYRDQVLAAHPGQTWTGEPVRWERVEPYSADQQVLVTVWVPVTPGRYYADDRDGGPCHGSRVDAARDLCGCWG